MNIEQLESFVAVVKYDTFSEAAEELHVSQSSVSKKIISLEKELNITLFSREKRKVTLTDAGTAIYPECCKMLALHKKIQKTAKEFSEKKKHKLVITSLPILNQYSLIQKFIAFQNHHPDIFLEINEVGASEMTRKVMSNKIPLFIVQQDFLKKLSGTFEYKIIAEDEFALLVPSSHPFAQKGVVSFDELKDETFVLMKKSTTVYSTFVSLCHEHGFEPNIHSDLRLESISSSVATGIGISFIPLKNAEMFQNPSTAICRFDKKIASTIVLAKMVGGNLSNKESIFFAEF